jgi:hypothetical protein
VHFLDNAILFDASAFKNSTGWFASCRHSSICTSPVSILTSALTAVKHVLEPVADCIATLTLEERLL